MDPAAFLPDPVWVTLVIAAACVLGSLRTLATQVEREHDVRKLRREALALRRTYERRLAEYRARRAAGRHAPRSLGMSAAPPTDAASVAVMAV